MPVPDIRFEVLRQLVTEYQEAETKEKKTSCFERILFRIDNYIIYCTHQICDLCPHLNHYEFNELYKTALVGLGRALTTTKPHNQGQHILGRIRAYVRNEILTNHKAPQKYIYTKSLANEKIASEIYGYVINEEGYDRVDFEDELKQFLKGCGREHNKGNITMRDLTAFIRCMSGQGQRMKIEAKMHGVGKNQWKRTLMALMVVLRRLPLEEKGRYMIEQAIRNGVTDFSSPKRKKPSKSEHISGVRDGRPKRKT